METPALEEPRYIYQDEALEILGKFLKQTVRDYLTPALRFSRLTAERQYWETARRFIKGEIAVQWGDENEFITFEDAIAILNINNDWLGPHLDLERISREIDYIHKGRKKRKDLMAVVVYINCSEGMKQAMRPKLKKLGLLPIFSSPPPVEDQAEQPDLPQQEPTDINVTELEKLDEKETEAFLDDREEIRKRTDRNMLLINKSDLAIFVWDQGVNELQLLTEIALCYQTYTPVILLAQKDGPPLEKEMLAYVSQVRFTLEDTLETIRMMVGSGRATIQGAIRAKLADIVSR